MSINPAMQGYRTLLGAVMAALLLAPAAARAQVTLASPGPCPAPACAAPIESSQLQNLGTLEDEIKAYYQNGSYDIELSRIEADAARYIDKRVAAGVKKPALVLDIDDTALSTVGYELKYDFGYDPKTWNAYAVSPGFPANAPILALAKHAQAAGVAVFFVTGRRQPQTALTAKNLHAVGYTYVQLYLRPVSDKKPSVIPFKSSTRAVIEHAGYDVLETIGDQWSDLEGGYADRAYKLPNPMYFIP
jgi:predicted secreted acid phosphatase